ncbi:hypothetical protein A0H81_09373 [Grifola frondosa]|uniref:Uncharacterized protein n=1 Tax=Grifola frondosa TaxID=5627 RepID=A0A1C7M6H2_GRIFR|nr:hypothetical protein A0H81_09373 [Grifola frondosa]
MDKDKHGKPSHNHSELSKRKSHIKNHRESDESTTLQGGQIERQAGPDSYRTCEVSSAVFRFDIESLKHELIV